MLNNTYDVIIYYFYGDGDKDWMDHLISAKNIEEAFLKAKELRRWIYEMEIVSINDEKLKEKISWKQWKLKQHIPEKT